MATIAGLVLDGGGTGSDFDAAGFATLSSDFPWGRDWILAVLESELFLAAIGADFAFSAFTGVFATEAFAVGLLETVLVDVLVVATDFASFSASFLAANLLEADTTAGSLAGLVGMVFGIDLDGDVETAKTVFFVFFVGFTAVLLARTSTDFDLGAGFLGTELNLVEVCLPVFFGDFPLLAAVIFVVFAGILAVGLFFFEAVTGSSKGHGRGRYRPWQGT